MSPDLTAQVLLARLRKWARSGFNPYRPPLRPQGDRIKGARVVYLPAPRRRGGKPAPKIPYFNYY